MRSSAERVEACHDRQLGRGVDRGRVVAALAGPQDRLALGAGRQLGEHGLEIADAVAGEGEPVGHGSTEWMEEEPREELREEVGRLRRQRRPAASALEHVRDARRPEKERAVRLAASDAAQRLVAVRRVRDARRARSGRRARRRARRASPRTSRAPPDRDEDGQRVVGRPARRAPRARPRRWGTRRPAGRCRAGRRRRGGSGRPRARGRSVETRTASRRSAPSSAANATAVS